MLKIKHVAVCMLALAMLSAGCTNYSGNTYSGSQVRSAQTVQYGTVVSVQPVTLEEDRSRRPWDSGRRRRRRRARQYGWWRTREDAGDYRGCSPRRGWWLCRREGADQAEWPRNYGRTGNGQQLSIVQAADQQFSPGERVRVLRGSDGSARVTR